MKSSIARTDMHVCRITDIYPREGAGAVNVQVGIAHDGGEAGDHNGDEGSCHRHRGVLDLGSQEHTCHEMAPLCSCTLSF